MLFFPHEQTGLGFTGKVLTVSLLPGEQHFEERGDPEKWVESYISIELEKFLSTTFNYYNLFAGADRQSFSMSGSEIVSVSTTSSGDMTIMGLLVGEGTITLTASNPGVVSKWYLKSMLAKRIPKEHSQRGRLPTSYSSSHFPFHQIRW